MVVDVFGEKADVFFYDGGHSLDDHYLALMHFQDSLADVFVFIVDDWGSEPVRAGTFASIEYSGFTVAHHVEVFAGCINCVINSSTFGPWHNGMGLFVLKK